MACTDAQVILETIYLSEWIVHFLECAERRWRSHHFPFEKDDLNRIMIINS
jgi:hypothetical protein